jgi:seryl-tRNA synthetase
LIALIENNYNNEDRSITIPISLQSFVDCDKIFVD